MKFQLSIDLGNAAMQDNHDVAGALRDVAERLSKFTSTGWSPYALDGKIKDVNGNTVGTWEVKPDVEWSPVVHCERGALKPSIPSPTEPTEDDVAALAGEERRGSYMKPFAFADKLAQADTIHNDPEGGPIMRRVTETFDALTKARNHQSRVSRPEAVKAAAIAYKAAEKEYRKAAGARDRFVEIWNGRKMQRSVAP